MVNGISETGDELPKDPKVHSPMTSADVAAARQVLGMLSDKKVISYANMAKAVNSLCEKVAKDRPVKFDFDDRSFELKHKIVCTDTQLQRFAKQQHTPHADVLMAIFCWLAEVQPDSLRRLRLEFSLPGNEAFVAATRALIKGQPDFPNLDQIEAFAGIYRVFRPFHQRPNEEVILSTMVIGADPSRPFDVQLKSAYTDYETMRQMNECLTGKIVPIGARAFIILPYNKNDFVHLTVDMKLTDIRDRVDAMWGTFVSLTRVQESASFAFYAVRSESEQPAEVVKRIVIKREIDAKIYRTN